MLSSKQTAAKENVSNLAALYNLYKKSGIGETQDSNDNDEQQIAACKEILELSKTLNPTEDCQTGSIIASCNLVIGISMLRIMLQNNRFSLPKMNEVIAHLRQASHVYPFAHYYIAKSYLELKSNEIQIDKVDYDSLIYSHLFDFIRLPPLDGEYGIDENESLFIYKLLNEQAARANEPSDALKFIFFAYQYIKRTQIDSAEIEVAMGDSLSLYGGNSLSIIKCYLLGTVLGHKNAIDKLESYINKYVHHEAKKTILNEINSIRLLLGNDKSIYDVKVTHHLLGILDTLSSVYNLRYDRNLYSIYIGMVICFIRYIVIQKNNTYKYSIATLNEAEILFHSIEDLKQEPFYTDTINDLDELIEKKFESLGMPRIMMSIDQAENIDSDDNQKFNLSDYLNTIIKTDDPLSKKEKYDKLHQLIRRSSKEDVDTNKVKIARLDYHYAMINYKLSKDVNNPEILENALQLFKSAKKYGCSSAVYWIVQIYTEQSIPHIGEKKAKLRALAINELVELASLIKDDPSLESSLYELNNDERVSLYKLLISYSSETKGPFKILREFALRLIIHTASLDHFEAMHEKLVYFLNIKIKSKEVQYEILFTAIRGLLLGQNALFGMMMKYMNTQFKTKTINVILLLKKLNEIKPCLDSKKMYQPSTISKLQEIINIIDLLFKNVLSGKDHEYTKAQLTLQLQLIKSLVQQPHIKDGNHELYALKKAEDLIVEFKKGNPFITYFQNHLASLEKELLDNKNMLEITLAKNDVRNIQEPIIPILVTPKPKKKRKKKKSNATLTIESQTQNDTPVMPEPHLADTTHDKIKDTIQINELPQTNNEHHLAPKEHPDTLTTDQAINPLQTANTTVTNNKSTNKNKKANKKKLKKSKRRDRLVKSEVPVNVRKNKKEKSKKDCEQPLPSYIFDTPCLVKPPVYGFKPVGRIVISNTAKMVLTYLPKSLLVGGQIRDGYILEKNGAEPDPARNSSDTDIVTALRSPPSHIDTIKIGCYLFYRSKHDPNFFVNSDLNCDIYFSENLSTSIKKDASSRDFTINALYAFPQMNIDGKESIYADIYDPLGLGIKHLDAMEIHSINVNGNPLDSMINDPKRVLRYTKLRMLNFKGMYDRRDLIPAVNQLYDLINVNQEQIHYRLNRHFMEQGYADRSLLILNRYGIFQKLFGGISDTHFKWLRTKMQMLDSPDESCRIPLSRRGLVYSYFVAARIMSDIDKGMEIDKFDYHYTLSIMTEFRYPESLISYLIGNSSNELETPNPTLFFSKIKNDVMKYYDKIAVSASGEKEPLPHSNSAHTFFNRSLQATRVSPTQPVNTATSYYPGYFMPMPRYPDSTADYQHSMLMTKGRKET